MNLERLRGGVLEQVRIEAERAVAAAEKEHSVRRTAAQKEAKRLIAEARAAGARDASEEAARIGAAARRQARGRVLAAKRELFEGLQAAVLQEVQTLRGDRRYAALLDRLAAAARSQLGPDAELEVDPAESGGVIGRKGVRLVDYSLPALTARCIAALGPRVEGLWR